jgi:hypothetical protein
MPEKFAIVADGEIQRMREEMAELGAKLEAAEKRIAELKSVNADLENALTAAQLAAKTVHPAIVPVEDIVASAQPRPPRPIARGPMRAKDAPAKPDGE